MRGREMVTMGKGSGFGKIVLFGDHFVVYGLPGIASSINDLTVATIEKAEKFEFIDNRPATEGYKEKKQCEIESSLKLILDAMRIDAGRTPVKITLSGDLFCTSGVGASAAMATAVARAFSDYFSLNLDDEEINKIAFEGEKGAAGGTTTGIDNTCSTFGGVIWFRRDVLAGRNKIESIKVRKPIEMVLGNTGLTSVTSAVISDVRELKAKNTEKFEKIFGEYEKMVREGRLALEQYDLKRLGTLMNQNHKLLQQMEVSCRELDFLVNLAKEHGAQGAKMTGTGRGGYMVALTPGEKVQEKVAKAIEKQGFNSLRTKIG